MKLFGSSRRASRLQDSRREKKLSGTKRGILMLSTGALVLLVTVAAVYMDFVKPVEIKDPAVDHTQTETTFRPPTVIQTQTKVDEETGEEVQVEIEVPAGHKEGFYNVLVVGTDDDGTRTDTIMIARLDTEAHTAALLSIPRDTLIESVMSVPKINGAYGYAGKGEKGMDNLRSHLAKLLGFEVDAYVMVDLDGFVELVDLVGGVEFDVPMRMYYNDPTQDLYIDLEAGKQRLDGDRAIQLVRYRSGYATQDLQRTQVQQQFLQALAKQCLKVVNLSKLGSMVQLFGENVTTDLTLGNMAYFGQELLKCDFDEMYTYTLEGESIMIDGLSYYALYLNRTLAAVNEYFNPYDGEITADNVVILTPEYVRYLQQEAQPEEPEEEIPEEVPEELPEDWLEDVPWPEFIETETNSERGDEIE